MEQFYAVFFQVHWINFIQRGSKEMKMKWASVAKSSATKCKAQICEADLQHSILVNYLIIKELKRSFRNLKFRPPKTAYSPRMKGRDLGVSGLKNELECICQITQTFWHHLTKSYSRHVYLLIFTTPMTVHSACSWTPVNKFKYSVAGKWARYAERFYSDLLVPSFIWLSLFLPRTN